jgi:hypothetical protein
MELPTDTANLAEIHAFYLRRARIFYQERVDLGHTVAQARSVALAYLRRKTQWPEPMAAGALDRELMQPE